LEGSKYRRDADIFPIIGRLGNLRIHLLLKLTESLVLTLGHLEKLLCCLINLLFVKVFIFPIIRYVILETVLLIEGSILSVFDRILSVFKGRPL
jgi:hypothetical protein